MPICLSGSTKIIELFLSVTVCKMCMVSDGSFVAVVVCVHDASTVNGEKSPRKAWCVVSGMKILAPPQLMSM